MKDKNLRKSFRACGFKVHVRITYISGVKYYQARYRKDGYDICVSKQTLEELREAFVLKAREQRQARREDTQALKAPRNFKEFTLYYFETFRKRKVGKKTYYNDMCRLKTVFATLGHLTLRQITPYHCQKLIDDIVAKGHFKSAREVASLLNGIFKNAIAHHLITLNPMQIVIINKGTVTHGKALTKEEEERLLNYFEGKPQQIMFAVALYTGLRPNEFSSAELCGKFIVATNSKRKNGSVEKKRIPICPMLAPYLEGVTTLHFHSLECIRASMRKALPNHRLYDLRTTFYSRCQECGVSNVARMKFVGHSLGALGDAYTDLSDEYLIAEAQKINY